MAKLKLVSKIILLLIFLMVTLSASLLIIYDKLADWSGVSDSYCNVARINLSGEITTSSTDDFLIQLKATEEDERVKAILISFDSPGGSLSGGEDIRSALSSSTKPIIGVIREGCYSSCYLALTGLKQINLGPYSEVGGVGVIMEYYDATNKNFKEGIVYDPILSAKFKNITTPDRKMTKEERAMLQNQINCLGDIFVNQVKTVRRLSDDQLAKIKNAESYHGQKAVDVGLADRVVSWLDIMDELKQKIDGEDLIWCNN